MDRYQKMMIAFLIAGVSIALIYFFVVIGTPGGSGSSTDDSDFPYFIIFSSWPAIFIPLIARKRQEAKEKEEELKKQYEV